MSRMTTPRIDLIRWERRASPEGRYKRVGSERVSPRLLKERRPAFRPARAECFESTNWCVRQVREVVR